MLQSTCGSERCSHHQNPDISHQHGQQCYLGDLLSCFSVNIDNSVEDSTPVAKLPCGSVLRGANSTKSTKESSNSSTTKTPPVEASVSPEIQCGLSHPLLVSGATPTCYGAGHVVSGVADKRKCRPRGILSAGHTNSFDCSTEDNIHYVNNSGNEFQVFRKSRPSLIPLPVEASISWHLSSFDEDEDYAGKGDYANGLCQSRRSVDSRIFISPSSPCGSACSNQGFLEPSSDKMEGFSSSTSPYCSPVRKGVLSQEERTGYNFSGSCSPFSVDSLSSGNVMQTPKSNSSSEKHHSLSWQNEGQLKHHFESELDLVTLVLQQESLSPKSHMSPWEPHMSLWDPPVLSVELAELSSPSNSVDLNHLLENSNTRAYSISDSTLESVSVSPLQISRRDGLASSNFDMDDLDICRLFSDEENDTDGCKLDNGNLSTPSFTYTSSVELQDKRFSDNGFNSPKLIVQEPRVNGNGKETSSHSQINSCAESISTDGGGLIASVDSDWTLYYKNRSFEI